MTKEQLAVAQGAYFVATGVWPFVHMRSFECVTGPKVDKWLVRTVGALIAVVGVSLVSAGLRQRVTAETAMLGAGAAIALGSIDVFYSANGRISRIYLSDAGVEAAIAAGWLR